MWTFLLTALGIYLLYLLAGCAVQRAMLFPRHMVMPAADEAELQRELEAIGGEQWWLDTDAGRVEAWFLPGEGVGAESPGPAVLYAHGNAELIDHQLDLVEPLRAMGVSVLLGEYRGYGRSAGKPSEQALVADFTELHDRLADHDAVDADRIVFYGRSIGTGVVTGVAQQRPPAAMILVSPFTSIKSIMLRYGIPPIFARDPFDNAAVLAELDRPVLLQHGRHDTIIAYRHSEALHELAPQSTLIGYDSGHNDFPILTAEYWRDVQQFLTDHAILTEVSNADR